MIRLSPRERQIVECVGRDGFSNPAAARHLGISIHTFKTHVRRIVDRAGVRMRTPRETLVALYFQCVAPKGDAPRGD